MYVMAPNSSDFTSNCKQNIKDSLKLNNEAVVLIGCSSSHLSDLRHDLFTLFFGIEIEI